MHLRIRYENPNSLLRYLTNKPPLDGIIFLSLFEIQYVSDTGFYDKGFRSRFNPPIAALYLISAGIWTKTSIWPLTFDRFLKKIHYFFFLNKK